MAKPTAKVKRAWITQYEAAFFYTLDQILRNDENAEEFSEFHAQAKRLTAAQLHVVAKYASEYFVEKANPNPGKVPENKIGGLMKEAIGEALKRIANDEQ